MGTNYYLLKKERFSRENKLVSTLGCGEYNYIWEEAEPRELINGWVWNNRYYATEESLSTDFYQKIHIGKSSAGWRFLLCRYPVEDLEALKKGYKTSHKWLTQPIETLEDWIKLFNNPENSIVDESGEAISPEKMVEIIAKRKPFESKRVPPYPHNQWKTVNGLYVHTEEEQYRPEVITIMPADCTYDLVWSGNNVEEGLIFS